MLKQSASAEGQIAPASSNPSRTLTSRLMKKGFQRRSDTKTHYSHLTTEAANFTYLVSQKDLLFDINPFEAGVQSADEPGRVLRQNTESAVSEVLLHPNFSGHCSRNEFVKMAEGRLNQIINPKSRLFSGFYRKSQRDRPKTEEQILGDDYISETKKAKKHERLVRAKI